ncbi:MAG: hypothetical protein ACJAX1_001911, partial [Neolewinella sp.]
QATVSATAGTYDNLFIIDENGCVSQEDQDVVLNDPASAEFATIGGPGQTICLGESADLDFSVSTFSGGTPPFTVIISDGTAELPPFTVLSDVGTLTVNPTATTTYSLISVVDANGCSASLCGDCAEDPVITVNPLLTATLTSSNVDTPVCTGETVTFTASGGTFYRFYFNGEIIQEGSEPTYTTDPLLADSEVYVEIANNGEFICSDDSDVISTTVNDAPVMASSLGTNPTTCGGLGEIAFDFNFEFDELPEPTIADGTYTIFYDGGSFTDVIVTDGQAIVFAIAGTYNNLFIVDENGCTSQEDQDVTLEDLTLPTAGLISSDTDNAICGVVEVTFTASGGMTYEFFLNGISIQGPTTNNSYVTNLLANGDEVYVTLVNAESCSATSATIITSVSPVPEVEIEAISDALCAGALPFTITGIPASANGSFSSDLPNGLTDNGDGTAIVDPSLIPPGMSFMISYSYTSEDGCEASASTEIEVNALPDAGFTGLATTYFSNDLPSLITPNETGGVFSTSGGVVLIDNGDGTVTLDPGQIPIGGPYDVTYTLTDTNGCTNEQVQVFSITPVTEVSFSGLLPTYCEGEEAVSLVGLPADENGAFSATVPEGALVDNGDGTAILTLAGLNVNTVFELTYTYSEAGQTIETTQSFQVLAAPFIDLPETLTICGETTISVGPGNEGNTILWSTGATTPELRVSEAGPYTVQVTTPDGCTAAASIEVSAQAGIELITNFLVADEVCIGERLQFIDVSSILDGVISYSWEFGDGNTSTERDPIHAYSRDGIFEVTLTAEVAGCDVIIVTKPVLIINCGRGSGASVFGGISIFPNPSPGKFQIDVNLRRQEIVKITVVDVYGKIIAVRNSADRFSHSFYFADVKTGVYYVSVQSYGQREIKQVVVTEGY